LEAEAAESDLCTTIRKPEDASVVKGRGSQSEKSLGRE
jgi:hypothetical protein